MQKAHHDTKMKETKYLICENVMAKNYRNGPKWLPGVIVEQLGTLTFLIQLDNGMFGRDLWINCVAEVTHPRTRQNKKQPMLIQSLMTKI